MLLGGALRPMLGGYSIEQGAVLALVLPGQHRVVRQHPMLKRIKAGDLVAFNLSFQICWLCRSWPYSSAALPLVYCLTMRLPVTCQSPDKGLG